PIVRPPFPKPVRDRSPIIGVSANLTLRTCFRTGEALNAGCQAVRLNRPVLIELYAKVDSSHRNPDDSVQHFVFSDLFHDRPPYIYGTYDSWKTTDLWSYDSGRFLDCSPQGKCRLCRCVGRMKRENNEWKFVVLNIWEATWEDIEWVKGIVCG
ncbi:hypothetical protein K402DRAFT_341061, partial [Aulographum hederae CBS 113979]